MSHTQCERLLDYLKRHGNITDPVARGELGIARLASRVNDLRKDGWDIQTEIMPVVNRWGEKCRVAKYILICDEQWRLAI